jgi:hypothetical protein
MKLTKIHLFLILIFALILASSLGNYIRDGFTTTKPTELPPALQPIATKTNTSNASSPSNLSHNPNVDAEVNSSFVGSSGSSLSPSTFPMNSPAGIPGLNSINGNDQANTIGSGGSGGSGGSCIPKPQCPPCPACARCPEPAFECKKVPNYSRTEDINTPRPIMADFSQFGM